MELKNYIENAEKKAGSQKKLSDILGISAGYIRMAKGEKRGFPEAICIKLADYLDEDRLSVIAASGLVTEKDQERRKILESCFRRTSKAANFIIAALFVALISITSPNPANASQATVSDYNNLYYVKLFMGCLKYGKKSVNHYQVSISFLNPFHNIHILLNVLISAK